MNNNIYITRFQAHHLEKLGFNEPKLKGVWDEELKCWLPIVTVDEAIDWLRRKFNVHIYTAIEPFVDTTNKEAPVLYRYTVKYCSRRDGWNGRIYIGQTRLAKNVYSLKRQAITLAIRWLNKRNKEKKTLSK